jgi:hypothetical protein
MGWARRGERVGSDEVVGHWLSADQVFGEDAFEDFR